MSVTEEAHKKNIAATPETGVRCELDGVYVHSIEAYLAYEYPEYTLAQYQKNFHGSPIISATLEAAKRAKENVIMESATVLKMPAGAGPSPDIEKTFHEAFGLPDTKATRNSRGDPIKVVVLGHNPQFADMVPAIDPNYIFNIDLLKQGMMAVQLNIPALAWGLHGTGKTTLFEQIAAHTNRPFIRVQHTVSTEEAHVLGQFVLRGQETVFNPGPLAVAMRYGLIYMADEYDFALPSVTSVYQPVLEGKSLLIKEACPEWRVVKPHPNFRFFATGNTNGSGDETGLYQGTQIQNAANYSRFGITMEVGYMPDKQETAVVQAQGGIHQEDAEKLVRLAGAIRQSFQQGDISTTVSPRELIRAAQLGRVMGGKWRDGIALAYSNRLNQVDRAAVNGMVQRIFAD